MAAVTQVFSSKKHTAILGGNNAKASVDGYSYWAAEPVEIFQFQPWQNQPLEKLDSIIKKYHLDSDQDVYINETSLPRGIFIGGWIGYFGYELAGYIEKLPQTTIDDMKIPLVRLCFYDKVICYDHCSKCFWLVALEFPGENESPDSKLDYLENLLIAAADIHPPEPKTADIENIDFGNIQSNMSENCYLQAFKKIKKYIIDGTVYQVNFSQRFEHPYNSRAIDLFHWQNHYNPSGYSAFIDANDFAIVSASPELFARISDGVIRTMPIKGTRPRLRETSENSVRINERNYNELLNCEKEKAELNMIIDLERNDLARICIPGTRYVTRGRYIQAHPTVYHAVAAIEGTLKKNIAFSEILTGIFPGGSITGAPKISSMQIIDELEPTQRSVYTGCIGFIGIDGNVCLNIAIRTIIITSGKAYAQAGGGIVADSDPTAEWNESITKARALLAGIKAVQKI